MVFLQIMDYNVLKKGIHPFCIFNFLLLSNVLFSHSTEGVREFSNEWAVEINGGDLVATEVANLHGFLNHGKVNNLNLFLLKVFWISLFICI